jgi:endonuclease-3
MPPSRTQLKSRTAKVIELLASDYPRARTALTWSNPLELLIATILSAQAADAAVNKITPPLFARYRTPQDWAGADTSALQEQLKPTGMYRNKTRAVQGACRAIIERHGGQVPRTMEELVELPGVARKTASVVLANAFGVPAIAVDRHVARVSWRLGLTKNTDPVKIEQDLKDLAPQKDWIQLNHSLILHGRNTCTARAPRCGRCPLNKLCPSAFKVK